MAKTVQQFGGHHTELKLKVLAEYLSAYLRVMQKQNFQLTYIDAFAGTGWSRARYYDDERQTGLLAPLQATKGSALRVFDVANSGRGFDRYVFNDRRRTAMSHLKGEIGSLFSGTLPRPEIQFSSDNADDVILRECNKLKSRDRAVMFLDPFGMQVSWTSIERVAQSHQIDLWYLAPVGGAYSRLMQVNGRIPEERRKLLDQALGGRGWYNALYQALPPDMLRRAGTVARDRGIEAIAGYFIGQWREVFGVGALDVTLPLGRSGRLEFLLCFACSNPSPPAYRAALKIARCLVEGARGGRLI